PRHRALERVRMQVGDAGQAPARVGGGGQRALRVGGGVHAVILACRPGQCENRPMVDAADTWDGLAVGVSLATLDDADGYGTIEDGALAWRDGLIAWVGPRSALPAGTAATHTHDFGGGWITPGLVDCHTHLVFAGNRAGEFEMRLQGASYESIARAGGGILSTVRNVRAAS